MPQRRRTQSARSTRSVPCDPRLGSESTWYPRCIIHAGRPLLTTLRCWQVPFPRPRVTIDPRLWMRVVLRLAPAQRPGTRLLTSRLPSRTAFCASGKVSEPGGADVRPGTSIVHPRPTRHRSAARRAPAPGRFRSVRLGACGAGRANAQRRECRAEVGRAGPQLGQRGSAWCLRAGRVGARRRDATPRSAAATCDWARSVRVGGCGAGRVGARRRECCAEVGCGGGRLE
jgi:hypothetical protein